MPIPPRSFLFSLTSLAVALLAIAPPSFTQEEGKRVALVIGNNTYAKSPLRNAINDARSMAKALEAAGFKVILKEDAGQATMEEAAAKFAEQLGPDDTALFFYAGHGIQIESENLLVPIDFEAANTVVQAKFKCFHLSQLFEELKKRSKRSIIILDACRSNPVSQANGLPAGLAQPQVSGAQTYIAFSTDPGQVAADNPAGRNSYFTEALAEFIGQPSLTLDEVFTRVKSRVTTETENRQTPWTQSNLTSTFYFHAPANLQVANDPAVAQKWMLDAERFEQRGEWEEAEALVKQVISRKPGGRLEAMAKAKLPYLELRKDADEKYLAGDYKSAAAFNEKTLELDPFATDAAFQAINQYLLSDHLPEAVHLLSVVRLRGSSASVEKADAMLKELAPVHPEAASVIKAELPKPPDIHELFNHMQFGTPDWSAGFRSTQASPMPLGRWAKNLEIAYPPPAAPVEQTADAAKIEDEFLHVEVNPATEARDITIARAHDPSVPTGALIIMGSLGGPAKVIAVGEQKADALPVTLALPAGKYKVQTILKGVIIDSHDVEITVLKTSVINLQKPGK